MLGASPTLPGLSSSVPSCTGCADGSTRYTNRVALLSIATRYTVWYSSACNAPPPAS